MEIRLGGIILEYVASILRKHGCNIYSSTDESGEQKTIVMLPDGSSKKEAYPRTLEIRYHIVLPDGFMLCEIQHRNQEGSNLLVPDQFDI